MRLDPAARETPVKCRLTLSIAQPDGELVAANTRLVVVLDEAVRPGLAMKTAPERKLLGPLGNRTELAVGEIAGGELHSLLLQMRAPQRSAGKLELARVELLLDLPSRGLTDQRQEVRLVATYGEPEPEVEVPAPEVEPADERDEARLIDDFLDAYRRGYREDSVATLRLLIMRCPDAGRNERLQRMLGELEERGKLSKEHLDELSVGSAGDPQETSLFDVILIDAGERPIKVAREIRAATGLGLRDVTELVKSAGATIGRALRFAQAGALQRRVQAVGARAEVRRVESAGPDR